MNVYRTLKTIIVYAKIHLQGQEREKNVAFHIIATFKTRRPLGGIWKWDSGHPSILRDQMSRPQIHSFTVTPPKINVYP